MKERPVTWNTILSAARINKARQVAARNKRPESDPKMLQEFRVRNKVKIGSVRAAQAVKDWTPIPLVLILSRISHTDGKEKLAKPEAIRCTVISYTYDADRDRMITIQLEVTSTKEKFRGIITKERQHGGYGILTLQPNFTP